MLSKKHHVVLLGSSGTGTAFAAVTALRRVWGQKVHVVAIDINPRHMVTTSLLANDFIQVPFSSSPNFSKTLIEIIKDYHVDTYLPLLPDEIMLAAQLREQKQIPASLTILGPSLDASIICADKWLLSQLLQKHGVLSPKSAPASDPFAADTLFLKPRDGSGSRGARAIKTTELAAAIQGKADEWVVQEICTNPEVTVDAFHDPSSGFIHSVCRERIEVKAGVSTKCRLFIDEILGNYALNIADSLNLVGSFCFQVMRNAEGWVVTDVNPRPGAATAMCAATGNDFFAATFARSWGEDFNRFFQAMKGECFVTRQYSEFLMSSKT